MTIICVTAVIEAVPPFHELLKLNSSPKLNSKTITPISAQTSTLLISVTDGKNESDFQLGILQSNSLKQVAVLFF
jgi:hypothetical protein